MTIYSYVGVLSIDQNESRQIALMNKLGVEKENVYIDKMSGKNTDRPQYQALKETVVQGDTIIFDSITRLSRNYYDIKDDYPFIAFGICTEGTRAH